MPTLILEMLTDDNNLQPSKMESPPLQNPFSNILEDLKLQIQSASYKRTLLKIQRHDATMQLELEHHSWFQIHITHTPTFVSQQWLQQQKMRISQFKILLAKEYIQHLEKQVEYLDSILYIGRNGPVLTKFKECLTEDVLQNTEEGEERILLLEKVEEAVDNAQEHMMEWIEYGHQRAFHIESIHGMPSNPPPYQA